ncbi:MAG: glutathione S-transferase family protein [Beijerinckiaceae bacterium]|jgi:ganglioside-induced differentiation-associated protein 1|nr:glutathione S-transferase family protein [Beijerinckiaceae bacterium]
MLTLYHHGSSVCAAKVRFALDEKKLAWEGSYLDILAGEQFSPEYLKINPRAMVPALVHDGRTILESTVICEYLEQVFPDNPVYPADPYDRAQARIWTKAVDEDLHPSCSAITYVASHRHAIRKNVKGFEDFLNAPSNESVETRKRKWQWIEKGFEAPDIADRVRLYDRYLHLMEDALAASPWLAGEQFSIADIALTPYVNRLDMLSMQGLWQGGRLPHVTEWFSKIRARPAFRPALLGWIPAALANDLACNGAKSWPEVQKIIFAS